MEPHPDSTALTWRDQLIELDLPGVGPISACADPELLREPAADGAGTDGAGFDGEEPAFRRREPTSPPPRELVLETLRGRPPLALEHTWLVLPALGPVLPTQSAEGNTFGDLSGEKSPFELRLDTGNGSGGPSPEGWRAGALTGRESGGIRPPQFSWFRLPVVAAALRSRGVMVARGALVGPRREWFEPAAAARADLLAAHPDQAREIALSVARDQGQSAVLSIGPEGLDVIPTGTDPRVPALDGLPALVTRRPAGCPLQGSDCAEPCRPVGGPWIDRARRAQVEWEARRSQALAVQQCGVCFGEALPPEDGQPAVPRLAAREPVVSIDRLHLRGGDVVRIDPIAPNRPRARD